MSPGIISAQEPFFRQIVLTGTGVGFRINTICQDSSRFMWLATNDGIWKNEGTVFTKLKLPADLDKSNVTSIFPLPRQGIIAGTSAGRLFTVISDSITLIDIPVVEEPAAISSIYVAASDDIWFATLGNGITRIKSGMVTHFSTKDGLGDDYVYEIIADSFGRIWCGSDGGLSHSEHSGGNIKFINFSTKNGLPENIVRKVTRGPGNTLGIGMEEQGFCFYDPASRSFIIPQYFKSWTFGPIQALMKLENEYWIGAGNSGITDFEFQAGKRVRRFDGRQGFSGGKVNAMMKDHEGNIWIASGGDLYLSPGEKIEFKKEISGLGLNNIHTILIDKKSNIWFSNDEGLFCFRKDFPEDVAPFRPLEKTPYRDYNIISLYEDNSGSIWMGTFDHGVIRFNPENGSLKTYAEKEGLINSNVLSIDGSGNTIWFATLGGVSRCVLDESNVDAPVRFESFSEEHGLGNNFIYKVFVDSRNRVWFGTDGRGITSFDKGMFVNYGENRGLKSKIIYSITEDLNRNIWLSSSGDGIYRFDGKSFRNLSLEQGLSDLNITSLIADRHGNIIIVNKKNIDALNPANLHLVSFGSDMGVTGIDPDVNVVETDIDGNVWLGTSNGIIKLNLEEKIGEKKPILVLKNVLCFLEKVDTSRNVFPHNRNHFSFDFTTLWFSEPQKISFQYKLEGYNREWITTGDRFVTYPNLMPGDYTFMVRTSVNNNFSDSDVVSYTFRIRYPFWQRSWFIGVMACIAALLLYFYIRYRDNKMKNRERIKKEKIESQYEILKNQVNPHFLFNSFNTLITVIEDDPDVAIEYVNRLSDFFRCILTYREKDLISIDEELQLVETYIFLQQKRYGSNFTVDIRVKASYRQQCLIPPLALQILVENSLKHNAVSRETQLKVEIFIEQDQYLVVRNNINPKLHREPSTGIGLQNLKNRYQLISHTEIMVEEDKGFFCVKLPLVKIKEKAHEISDH